MSLISVFLGFALFRLFDIAKPWPISWLEKRFSGAFGIMIDDMVAGLLAGIILFFFQIYG
jgi:phosphatidylglycerophosphatase A